MKKQILTVLLSALLITNATACQSTSDHQNLTPDEPCSEDAVESLKQPLTVDFQTYDSIISTYRNIVELCPRYETANEDDEFVFANSASRDLYEKIFHSTLLLYPRDGSGIDGNCYDRFGYSIQDLNNDGMDELILRLDDHQVIAIFSTVNNSPVLLDHYWNRNSCWIDPDGYIHVHGSNGADHSVNDIYRIADQTGELILLEEYGTDGYDSTSGETVFFKLVDNEKIGITQEEYNTWVENLPYEKFEVTATISEYMNFIPLFTKDHPAPEPYISPSKG